MGRSGVGAQPLSPEEEERVREANRKLQHMLKTQPPTHTSLSELRAPLPGLSRKRSGESSGGAVHVPAGWGAAARQTARSSLQGMGADGAIGPLNQPPPPEAAHLAIKDLDTGRTIPFEQADMLWQPLLVRDLDANVLLPFAPVEGRSTSGEEMLNPPPEQLRFMSCSLERSVTPPPLLLPEYKLHKVSRKRKVEMFSACRRVEEPTGSVHFDIRWKDGVLNFTGKLELLPRSPSPHVQELAMYDDFINYYGFPRELGFIRTKLLAETNEASAYIEVIIPRVASDGAAAQFRVGAVPGHSMLTMYKARRAREHMFVLRGRLSVLENLAMDELRHRDDRVRHTVEQHASRTRSGRADAHPWRAPLRTCSAPPRPCVLLAFDTGAMRSRAGRCSPFHSPAARGLQMPRPQAADRTRAAWLATEEEESVHVDLEQWRRVDASSRTQTRGGYSRSQASRSRRGRTDYLAMALQPTRVPGWRHQTADTHRDLRWSSHIHISYGGSNLNGNAHPRTLARCHI